MTIYELADLLDKDIIVRRYANQKGRFLAEFEGCETKESKNSGILIGSYGNGNSPIKALNDYATQIAGMILVFNAGLDNRTEFVCPKLDLLKE